MKSKMFALLAMATCLSVVPASRVHAAEINIVFFTAKHVQLPMNWKKDTLTYRFTASFSTAGIDCHETFEYEVPVSSGVPFWESIFTMDHVDPASPMDVEGSINTRYRDMSGGIYKMFVYLDPTSPLIWKISESAPTW